MSAWIVYFLCMVALMGTAVAYCPYRCLCFRTTVRCMFLQLEKVPETPLETTILDLRFNKIKEIPSYSYKNLKKLNTLLLNNNHISKIEDNAFYGLKELRYLYLYKNRIKTIHSTAFKGLHKLEQLYIHFNKIETIEPDTFADLPALERLFLHNNKLSRIPPGVFKKLNSLRRLRLDSNALICDCEIMWLAQMLKQNHIITQTAATCEYPRPLQGKSLMGLNTDEFKCEKPKLTEEPNDVDVSFGGTVYFSCKAEGDPQPNIIWLHNNNEINPENKGRYNVLNDGTLMITEAQDLDKGVYECIAKNAAGEVKSRAAKMHYLADEAKPQFVETPEDHIIPEGSTFVLPCTVTGQPFPEVRWIQNGVPLPKISRYEISPLGSLTIFNAQRLDGGIYRCVATNFLGTISSAAAKLIIQAPPAFIETPKDQEVISGKAVEFICDVDGFPVPQMSWTKNGKLLNPKGDISLLNNGGVLRINNIQKSDEGLYHCLAENELGKINSSLFLSVKEKVLPTFSYTPQDAKAFIGSNMQLRCRADGDPSPKIYWKKDGKSLQEGNKHYQISLEGDLYMYNIKKNSEGTYECVAENEIGSTSVSMYLAVKDESFRYHPGDNFLLSALEEARQEVDKAINHTLQRLFQNTRQRSTSELMQAFRFPTDEARGLARAAEIYERSLQIVWKHVESGATFNLTEFSYDNLLSPSHLELLANLSGCLVHRQSPSCSDICFHRKYRKFDGSCNNIKNPTWGASLTPFTRLLPPEYENGLNSPVGWSQSHLYNGYHKPSARLVSSKVISTNTVSQDSKYSHMLMQWGQFLDHDMDFSMPSISHESFIEGVDCSTSCEYTSPCFPIDVPSEDKRIQQYRCMEFVRSSSLCGSGLTSVFLNQLMPREQVNQLTSFIDASNVYGSTEKLAQHLRNLTSDHGLLRYGLLMLTGKPLLPFNDGQRIDCKRDHRESDVDCFLTGDVRANEQLGLLAMHTLWMREHNRIATDLREYNPHWNGNKLYYEARRIVGAMMQHITYAHWLPKVLGNHGTQMLGPYNGYDPLVNPSITNSFATAAMRFGHTLINPELLRLNVSFQPIREGNIPLRKALFSPFRLVEEGGIDPLLRGLFYGAAKLRQPDQILNSELTEHLFAPAHLVAQDLAALNIQRGRDHGLPSYNAWRKYCNLTFAKSFEDFKNEIKDDTLLRKLQDLYGHPDNIDLWVGGVSEDLIDDAKVGPTFRCLLVDQFKKLRSGDRLWYENPGVFTSEQLVQIKQTSLGNVMCDSGDNITQITRDTFVIPQLQQVVDCTELSKMDLHVWTECCQECENSGEINSITTHQYRIKRSDQYSYPADRVHHKALNNSKEITSFLPVPKVDEHKTESDFDVTEQRIEGIEELVGKLEKTIHKLSAKLRKLEHSCKRNKIGWCRDGQGKLRKPSENWSEDSCTMCSCKRGEITCKITSCPSVSCKNPTVPEGQCCPVC